jgi:IS5 family transposase
MGDTGYADEDATIEARAPKAKNIIQYRGRGYRHLSEEQRSVNRNKSKVRAMVEHAVVVIKRVFGFTMVRYRGIRKNANRLFVAAALASLFMVRHRLMRMQQERCA